MEKTTFLKVFLISFLLMLFGQESHAIGCAKDGDCARVRCIDTHPKCDSATHQCICPIPPNYGSKRVHKTDHN
uniref:Putative ovule protein n=1 Tax=Solanum chacoense TaxID=4108 RepID=A0A0V0GHH6_SOLCH